MVVSKSKNAPHLSNIPLVAGGRALKNNSILFSGKFEISFVFLLLSISNLFEFVREKRLGIETLSKTQSTVIVTTVARGKNCSTVCVRHCGSSSRRL